MKPSPTQPVGNGGRRKEIDLSRSSQKLEFLTLCSPVLLPAPPAGCTWGRSQGKSLRLEWTPPLIVLTLHSPRSPRQGPPTAGQTVCGVKGTPVGGQACMGARARICAGSNLVSVLGWLNALLGAGSVPRSAAAWQAGRGL